jgi:hypothetical protein
MIRGATGSDEPWAGWAAAAGSLSRLHQTVQLTNILRVYSYKYYQSNTERTLHDSCVYVFTHCWDNQSHSLRVPMVYLRSNVVKITWVLDSCRLTGKQTIDKPAYMQ